MADRAAAMAVRRWEYVSEMDYREEGKSDLKHIQRLSPDLLGPYVGR